MFRLRLEKRNQIMAEINMIPFIDIALVLLIIFMIVTPFLVKSQISVRLPKATTAVSLAENYVNLQLHSNGQLFIDGEKINIDNLGDLLRLKFRSLPEKTVLIEADKETALEKVVEVMDIAKKEGAERLGLGTMFTNHY